jgi:hypothetical protein
MRVCPTGKSKRGEPHSGPPRSLDGGVAAEQDEIGRVALAELDVLEADVEEDDTPRVFVRRTLVFHGLFATPA